MNEETQPEVPQKALPNLQPKQVEAIPYIVEELPTEVYRDFVQDGKTYRAITKDEALAEMLMLMRRIDVALMGRLPTQ